MRWRQKSSLFCFYFNNPAYPFTRLCDRNLIDAPNIAGLCRCISENFCTIRQDNLSPRSIRNHIDNPLPTVLEVVMKELQVWERYLPKFIEQQRC